MASATMTPTKVTLSLLSLLLWPALAAAAPAPITEVVVYTNRAQVTRSQTADCGKGEVAFDGLPSTLEARSLWASLAGHGGGEVVGLTHREEASGPRPEAKALQERIRRLDEEIVATHAAEDAARATIAKLASFRSHAQQVWGLQAAARKPPVASWSAALDLLRQQALTARVRQRQAQSERRRLQRERQRLSTELGTIQHKRRRTTLTATVHLRCTGRRTVRLSYVVPHATWEMGYQLRSSPKGGKATLVVQAAVHQGTGEDWKNVTLAVSTANLGRRNIPPKLSKLEVSTFEPAETRKVLTRRFERRRHLTTASKDQLRASAQHRPSGAATAPRPGVPDEGIAFKLTAARRVTVPGDGRRTMVELARKAVRARYELETVPKLFPFVYNKVSLINPYSFTLLAGNVELHEGRTFLGRTTMKVRAPREPFSFSLGVEKRFQVHRFVKKEKLEGKRAFGNKKKLRHRYVIQVGNWDKRWRKVRVLENVPVSQVREVEVTMSDDSTKPTKWDKTDGVLTWELKLGPRRKKKLTLDYTVHLPGSYEVRGYY